MKLPSRIETLTSTGSRHGCTRAGGIVGRVHEVLVVLRSIWETCVVIVEVGYGWHSSRDGGRGAGTGTWDVPEKVKII